jgi:hypothetical protein
MPCREHHVPGTKKKADVVERPKALNHVGLLSDRPSGIPGCPSSDLPTSEQRLFVHPLQVHYMLSTPPDNSNDIIYRY